LKYPGCRCVIMYNPHKNSGIMRAAICLFVLASLTWSCNNNAGYIKYLVKYTTEDISLKSGPAEPELYHTGMGDYITSITPNYFGSKINVLMYLDQWQQGASMISYVDGHDNDPNYEIAINVDFSNNQESQYDPILYGDLWKGMFRQKEITFKYLLFAPSYFEQEFEIPAGYGSMQIIGQNGTYRTEPGTGKRFIKIYQQPLLEPFMGMPASQPWGYFFGNTETTYVFNKECADLPASEDSPNGGSRCMIRSHQFNPVTVTMPEEDETIEMYSTLSFNTDNLIQVYAGRDNTPYTVDDVFVYAPNYWERLKVRLEVR